MYNSLNNMLDISNKNIDWKPSIVKTTAIKNEGIEELYTQILTHYKFLNSKKNHINKYNLRYKKTVDDLLSDNFKNQFWTKVKKEILENELNKNFKSQLTPYQLVNKLSKK